MALDVTGSGDELGTHLVLDNLSAGGFYVRLLQPLSEDKKLFVVTQIAQAVIVLRGTVLRSELRADGKYGLACAILQHQIFSLVDGSGKQKQASLLPVP